MLAPLATTPAAAQGRSGRNLRSGVSFDKIPPGKQDEWLELYLKWHRPIMEYQIENGVTIGPTVYANSGHSIEPDLAFMIEPPAAIRPISAVGMRVAVTVTPPV